MLRGYILAKVHSMGESAGEYAGIVAAGESYVKLDEWRALCHDRDPAGRYLYVIMADRCFLGSWGGSYHPGYVMGESR